MPSVTTGIFIVLLFSLFKQIKSSAGGLGPSYSCKCCNCKSWDFYVGVPEPVSLCMVCAFVYVNMLKIQFSDKYVILHMNGSCLQLQPADGALSSF